MEEKRLDTKLGMEVGGTLLSASPPMIVEDGDDGEDECVMQHVRSDEHGYLCDLDMDPMPDIGEEGYASWDATLGSNHMGGAYCGMHVDCRVRV